MKVIHEANNATDINTDLYFLYEFLRTGREIK